MMETLEIRDLRASVNGKRILNGINMSVKRGELHILMGPNGSGKSTLSNVIMGNPKYTVDSGDILLDGKSILGLKPDERARAGLFLAFQEPVEISGVNVFNFIRTAYSKTNPDGLKMAELKKETEAYLDRFNLSRTFLNRFLNEGFSGGEKKRFEMLQMMVLQPKFAVMDEVDSGLDLDSLKIVGEMIGQALSTTGMLVVTHYERIFEYLKPSFIHVIMDGEIVETGGIEVFKNIKERGYEHYRPKGHGKI